MLIMNIFIFFCKIYRENGQTQISRRRIMSFTTEILHKRTNYLSLHQIQQKSDFNKVSFMGLDNSQNLFIFPSVKYYLIYWFSFMYHSSIRLHFNLESYISQKILEHDVCQSMQNLSFMISSHIHRWHQCYKKKNYIHICSFVSFFLLFLFKMHGFKWLICLLHP
jgi:hypothetical protein